jgi:hypothetical protein
VILAAMAVVAMFERAHRENPRNQVGPRAVNIIEVQRWNVDRDARPPSLQ